MKLELEIEVVQKENRPQTGFGNFQSEICDKKENLHIKKSLLPHTNIAKSQEDL